MEKNQQCNCGCAKTLAMILGASSTGSVSEVMGVLDARRTLTNEILQSVAKQINEGD